MTVINEKIDPHRTNMGPLSLRYRNDPFTGDEITQVMIGDVELMSSQTRYSEISIAQIALANVTGEGLDIVIGGLGLGYIARAVLDDSRVGHLLVVEAMPEIIKWHSEGLLHLGTSLKNDQRCRFVQTNFFTRAASEDGFDQDRPNRRHNAVILQIDHAPDKLIHSNHASFYTHNGLRRLAQHILPGGIIAIASKGLPNIDFQDILSTVFNDVQARMITFQDLNGDIRVGMTLYLAKCRLF
ncbi:spermidine synthase [Methylobacterium sp. WL103]|uniref:spermidine synthase n=1 Tax=Methylobacterium sp. WL103 TaxID=2603891 RepID=UPI0011CAAE1A|nr:spermidine synthase [Methylobacterium sp. WL103]TXN06658.1 spermidine synthase [Methylobacterium sp. WL103]